MSDNGTFSNQNPCFFTPQAKNPHCSSHKGDSRGRKGMLRDQNRFLCFLGAHLEQTCHVYCFSSGWAVKPVAALQLSTSKAKSWGPLVPQFPPKHQVPQGRVGLKEAVRRSKARAARKSLLNSRAESFLLKGHLFQDIILI